MLSNSGWVYRNSTTTADLFYDRYSKGTALILTKKRSEFNFQAFWELIIYYFKWKIKDWNKDLSDPWGDADDWGDRPSSGDLTQITSLKLIIWIFN